jgi:mycofactocin glycosyltransferase
MSRPAVSVIVPFLGSTEEAAELVGRLESLRTAPGDELIVADNCATPVVAPAERSPVRRVDASQTRSAAFARNAGAEGATGGWLLFLDADCQPPESLLDDYFAEPPDDRDGVVAGEVAGVDDQPAFLARWARSRRGHWVQHHLEWGPMPSAITANMLVRRSAFAELGGFRIGGGGDVDLSWRAQEAGWGFAYRPAVVVRHQDRERLSELADQAIAYGGHQRRLSELHTGVPRPPIVEPVARAIGGALVWAITLRFERAGFKLTDGLWSALVGWGWLRRGAGARKAD